MKHALKKTNQISKDDNAKENIMAKLPIYSLQQLAMRTHFNTRY